MRLRGWPTRDGRHQEEGREGEGYESMEDGEDVKKPERTRKRGREILGGENVEDERRRPFPLGQKTVIEGRRCRLGVSDDFGTHHGGKSSPGGWVRQPQSSIGLYDFATTATASIEEFRCRRMSLGVACPGAGQLSSPSVLGGVVAMVL